MSGRPWDLRGVVASIFALLIAGGAAPACCQRYLVHTYTENEGLPSSTVNDVLQDRAGRMWFATRSGIAMYDGVEWTTFSASQGLPHPNQLALALDAAGTLWAVSPLEPYLVSRFEDGAWIGLSAQEGAFDGEHVYRVTAFAVTGEGSQARVAVASDRPELAVRTGSGWRRFTPATGLPGKVTGLVSYRGKLAIATTGGLAELADGGPETTLFDAVVRPRVPSVAVQGLATESQPGKATRLWMLGVDWAGFVEDGRFIRIPGDVSLPRRVPDAPVAIEPDRRGGLFFGVPHGIAYLDRYGHREILDPSSGLITVGASAFALDREENLWIATTRGVSKLVSFRFATYHREHGLLEDEVSAILERRNGDVVLGHPGGLTFFETGGFRALPLIGPEVESSGVRVLDLAEDPAGALWVAGSALGLLRIDGEGRIRRFLGESGKAVTSVVVDSRGDLWTARFDGLMRWEDGRFVAVEGPPRAAIRRLFAGRRGEIYAASSEGLWALEDGRWTPSRSSEALGNSVFAVLPDAGDTLWVGTVAGLFRRDGARLARASLGSRQISRPIYFLVRDSVGRLWLGTDNGVLLWDGTALRHLTIADGLAGRETNRAAGLVDSDGRVWIGMDRGVSVYRRELDSQSVPGAPELLDVAAADLRFDLGEPVALRHDQNDLLFRFRALSFVDERRLRFRSWLEGYDSGWLESYDAPRQEIRYTNLPPGEYRFHLRIANAGGAWSEAASSAAIVIARPIWELPWFRALGLLAVIGLVYPVQRYFAGRRYTARLEAEVRKRTEDLEASERAAEQANRAKSQFLANMSHEIRTPMNGVLGLARLVRRADSVAEAHNYAELIRTSAESLLGVIDEILDFSKIEAGKLTLDDVEFDLRETLRRTVALLAPRAASKGLELELTVAEELPARLRGDPSRLRQVLLNLVGNALKFTAEGRVDVECVRGRREGDDLWIRGVVRDRGIGISAEMQERLFAPFTQADGSTSRRFGGTGLGLAICKRIVELMDGEIRLESEPGKGSTFEFSARFRVPESPQRPEPPAAELHRDPRPWLGSRVLLVEDNPVNQLVAIRQLEELGCRVDAVGNGVDALEAVARSRYDLVLMDCQLPGMDGYEVTRRLRAAERGGRHLPVVAVTAHAMSGDRQKCLQAGMDDYVAKPFQIETLSATLARWLGAAKEPGSSGPGQNRPKP